MLARGCFYVSIFGTACFSKLGVEAAVVGCGSNNQLPWDCLGHCAAGSHAAGVQVATLAMMTAAVQQVV